MIVIVLLAAAICGGVIGWCCGRSSGYEDGMKANGWIPTLNGFRKETPSPAQGRREWLG